MRRNGGHEGVRVSGPAHPRKQHVIRSVNRYREELEVHISCLVARSSPIPTPNVDTFRCAASLPPRAPVRPHEPHRHRSRGPTNFLHLLYENTVLLIGKFVGVSLRLNQRQDVDEDLPQVLRRNIHAALEMVRSRKVAMQKYNGQSSDIENSRAGQLALRLHRPLNEDRLRLLNNKVRGITTTIAMRKSIAVNKTISEYNIPTVYAFEATKVIVLSIWSGPLIRLVGQRVVGCKVVNKMPVVEPLCIDHSDTMSFLITIFSRYDVDSDQ